jgi:hypothetical protein
VRYTVEGKLRNWRLERLDKTARALFPGSRNETRIVVGYSDRKYDALFTNVWRGTIRGRENAVRVFLEKLAAITINEVRATELRPEQ